MMRLIKRLLGFTPPERVNPAVPTLRVARNDPGQPRTRSTGDEVVPRVPVPPTT
jgi:hypothetical protein